MLWSKISIFFLLLFLIFSCTPHYGFFTDSDRLVASQPFSSAWENRPCWDSAAVRIFPMGLDKNAVAQELNEKGTSWNQIVITEAVSQNLLDFWKRKFPQIRWAVLDPSAENLKGALNLKLDRASGWELLGRAAGELAKKKNAFPAQAFINAQTPGFWVSALKAGWEKGAGKMPLEIEEISNSEVQPQEIVKHLGGETKSIFILLAENSLPVKRFIVKKMLSFGELIPESADKTWNLMLLPDSEKSFVKIKEILKSPHFPETCNLPWKTVLYCQ